MPGGRLRAYSSAASAAASACSKSVFVVAHFFAFSTTLEARKPAGNYCF